MADEFLKSRGDHGPPYGNASINNMHVLKILIVQIEILVQSFVTLPLEKRNTKLLKIFELVFKFASHYNFFGILFALFFSSPHENFTRTVLHFESKVLLKFQITIFEQETFYGGIFS